MRVTRLSIVVVAFLMAPWLRADEACCSEALKATQA